MNTNETQQQLSDVLGSALDGVCISPNSVKQVLAFRGGDECGQVIVELTEQAPNRRFANIHFEEWYSDDDSHGGSNHYLAEYFASHPGLSVVSPDSQSQDSWITDSLVLPDGFGESCDSGSIADRVHPVNRRDEVIPNDDDRRRAADIAYGDLLDRNIIDPNHVIQIVKVWGDSGRDSDYAGFLIQLSTVPHLGGTGFVHVDYSGYCQETCCSPYVGSTIVVEYYATIDELEPLLAGTRFSKYEVPFEVPTT